MKRINRRQASRVRMNIKKSNRSTLVRRKSKFNFSSIFKRKKNKYSNRRRKISFDIKYIFFPILLLIVLGILYLSVNYVLSLRKEAFKNTQGQVEEVLGIEHIPTFPGSQFIFSDRMDDPLVKEFLSNGNSAYRLPQGKGSKEVEDYYFDKLKSLGWEYIQSVPLSSQDMKYGQYWIKENKGLRIYSKYLDIWYETISIEDAKSGMANIVKDEIEREMLMASSEKQDLLPDYPWKIQIPKEYIIKYSPTDMNELRAVSFQKLGSEEIVEIFPIGYWKVKELDYFLNDYCNIKSTQDFKYGVLNSIPVSFQDTLALKSTIKSPNGIVNSYTLPNSFNAVVYVISSTTENNPLLDYIFENIQPLGSTQDQ